MRLIIASLFVTLLTACSTPVPIVPKFPTPPDVLMEGCGPLNTIDKEVVFLSEFLKTVRTNYEKYHNCADLVLEWQNWYKEQKSLYEKTNK